MDPEKIRLRLLDEFAAQTSNSTEAVSEADAYLAELSEPQRCAFTSLRSHTVNFLKAKATRVSKELRKDRAKGAGFRQADLLHALKEYLRFRTLDLRVK